MVLIFEQLDTRIRHMARPLFDTLRISFGSDFLPIIHDVALHPLCTHFVWPQIIYTSIATKYVMNDPSVTFMAKPLSCDVNTNTRIPWIKQITEFI